MWLRSVPLQSRRTCFPVLFKSYCLLVALGTAVVYLFCVEPGPIVCLIRRIRRSTQSAGEGSSNGALIGIPIRQSTTEWPTECERLGYVSNPCSLKEGMETSCPVATVAVPPMSGRVTGSALQRKHELMRCTCCLVYPRCGVRQPDAKSACQCPLAHLVTFEVDRSL